MKKILRDLAGHPLLLFFAVFIIGFSISDAFFSKAVFSEMENRYLKQRPAFSWSSLVKNEYTGAYEEYVNDQFAFRDQWIHLKSVGEMALMKIENGGVAYGRDHYLFARLYPGPLAETRGNGSGFGGDGGRATALPAVSDRQIAANLGFLNRFLAGYPGQVTLAIAPNSDAVLSDKVPRGMENADQAAYIADIYADVRGAHTLDLIGPMADSAAARQTYYRTDHHWTTDGAWAAYAAFARDRGLGYVPLEDLADLRREEPGFLGTQYSKTKNIDVQPDTLVWYDIPVTDVTIDGKKQADTGRGVVEVDGLYHRDMLGRRDKYAAFLYGNHGLTVIRSGNNLNHQEGKTSRVLLVKDSYGNCMAPFLTYSYDEVYVADLRALPTPMSRLVAETDFDDVLILYNFTSFQQDKDLARITF